jgi:Flp pilus assembly protein TadG
MMQKPLSFRPSAGLFKLAGQLKADQKGGLMMIAGLAIVPMTFLVGFGVDYSRAMSLQTQLNAAADAAALAAVAPSIILQSDSEASAAATKMFNAQAALLTGYQDLQVTPTVTSSTSGGGSGALGPVEIQDSVWIWFVIQAPKGVCDGPDSADGWAVGEDGASLSGQGG